MIDLFKLCKHKKLPDCIVFVRLEKKLQIGRSQPKAILFHREHQIYSLSGCATSLIGWRRILLCFFLDVGLLLRTYSQLSKAGRSAIRFINCDPLHLQVAKPNLNFNRFPHCTRSGPNQTVEFSDSPPPPAVSPAGHTKPAGFQPPFKVEPVLPLPHVGPISDLPNPLKVLP